MVPSACSTVDWLLAFNGARADQPFSLFCQQTIVGGDVAISLSQHVNGSRRSQRFEFGCSLQILQDAAHLTLVISGAADPEPSDSRKKALRVRPAGLASTAVPEPCREEARQPLL